MSKTPSEQLKKLTEFEALARPLIEWLNDNYHPLSPRSSHPPTPRFWKVM